MAKDRCDLPVLMAGESEHNANLYYVSRFLAPDSFTYLCAGGEEYLFVSSMELGRARKESRVKHVINRDDYGFTEKIRKLKREDAALADVLATFMKEKSVEGVIVPDSFPLGLADGLRAKGVDVTAAPLDVEERRMIKTPAEIELVRHAQRVNEKGMARAIGMIRKSQIKGGVLQYHDEPLTAERIQREIELTFVRNGCDTTGSITAAGPRSADPHYTGAGPVPANSLIVLDLFPYDKKTHYFADMTRTVVRGKPTKTMKDMYALVLEVQEKALKAVRPGVSAKSIDDIACDTFEKYGYATLRTKTKNGAKEKTKAGYTHSIGHGVGLEIHEAPRLSQTSDQTMEAGMIVTVEPGLYDPEVGGVRIEDIVVVTKKGCEDLTKYPRELVA